MFPRACPGRFNESDWQKRSRSGHGSNAPRFESLANEAAPRPLRLSVLFGFEISLQWFISPYKASRTLGPHPPPAARGFKFPASETGPFRHYPHAEA